MYHVRQVDFESRMESLKVASDPNRNLLFGFLAYGKDLVGPSVLADCYD